MAISKEAAPFPRDIDAIREATRQDREALLDTVAGIFHKKSGDWLADRSWFRFAPEVFNPEGYWLATSQDDIVGVVAFRRFMLRMPHVNLPWVGVGSVCTKSEWRGKGIMQSMLQQGIQQTDEWGVPISILWGDRMRYGRFGWERAGRQIEFTLSRRYFPDPGWSESDVLKFAGEGKQTVVPDGLGERLTAIREKYDNRQPRPTDEQVGFLSRPGYETYVVQKNGEEAYLVLRRFSDESGRIFETVGPGPLVADLIGYAIREKGIPFQMSIVGVDLSEAEQMLVSRVNSMTVAPVGMVRIHDLAGLLSHYETWWATRQTRVGHGDVVFAMMNEEGVEEQTVRVEWSPADVMVTPLETGQRITESLIVSVDRRLLATILFGPLPLEVTMAENPETWLLKDIFPLPLHVPFMERV